MLTSKEKKQKHSIGVALIVRNEAQNLQACLESVADWVDEIVILDSGSNDETESIARQFTSKFYVNSDWPGFGKQRQQAQGYVESDYVLWLDADERISAELKQSITSILNQDKISNTLYRIPRLSWAFGRYIRHCGWYPDKVIRLYPTHLTTYDDALVHERVKQPQGIEIQDLTGDAIHYTYNNLHHYLVKSAGYAKAWADQRQAQGKKANLINGVTHALGCFVKMYLLKAGFLDGKQGFLLSVLSAHSTFVKYADLWERSQKKAHYK